MSKVSSVEPAGGFEFLIMVRPAESAVAKGYTFRVPKSAAHEAESRQARLDRWVSGLREVAGLSAKVSVRPPLFDLATGPNVGLQLFDATGAPIPFAQHTACLPALPRFSSFGTPSREEDECPELEPPDPPAPLFSEETWRSSPAATSPCTLAEATEPEHAPAVMTPSEPPASPEDAPAASPSESSAADDATSAEAAAEAVSPAEAEGAASPESPEDAWLLSPRDLRLRQLTPARLVAAGDASLASPIPSLASLGRGGGRLGGAAGLNDAGEHGWVRQLPHGSTVVGRPLEPSPFMSPIAPLPMAPAPSPASVAAQPKHRQPRPYVEADADASCVADRGDGTQTHEAGRRKPPDSDGRGAFVPSLCVQRTMQRIPRPPAVATTSASNAAPPAAAALPEAREPPVAPPPEAPQLPSPPAASSPPSGACSGTTSPAASAPVEDDEGARLFRRLQALDPAASEDDYKCAAADAATGGHAAVWDIEGLLSDIHIEELGGHGGGAQPCA